MAGQTAKRLAPEVRSAEILEAAKRLLDRGGVRGFTLEGVAREAKVAASLPRHYFGGSVDLLSAATIDVLREVEQVLRSNDPNLTLTARFSNYLDVIHRHPWGHSVWMRAGEINPKLEEIVRKARGRLAEAVYRRPWNSLTRSEQIQARGWVGFVEAVVSDWIERDFKDRQLVLAVLTHGIVAFQSGKDAAPARKVARRKPATRR